VRQARLTPGQRREECLVAERLSFGPPAADKPLVSLDRPSGVIGGFALLGVLGRGAAAEVYRVRRVGSPVGAGTSSAGPGQDVDGSPEYALKLLDVAHDGAGPGAAALRREAALLASVGHPGLVAIHEVGEHGGRPYVVMDLVDGRPLSDLLADGPMPPERVIALARDLAGLLAAVHRRGLVHRDLKPDNIMILADGRTRLIDFGLADRQSDASATIVGTLIYAAPEQTGLLRRAPDHRCDLYSLGAVLFECLTGRPPFIADEVAELLRLHATVPPPDLTELVPDVPAGLATVVATLLAKDPDDRYDDADQFLADLDRVEAGLAENLRPGAAPAEPFVPHRAAPGWARSAPRQNVVVGRSDEFARLLARWEAARRGVGGVWHVAGPAGVGKTALAAELATVAARAGSLVLYGRSDSDDDVPLAPLREALAGHLAQVERLPPAARQQAQTRIVAAAGRDAALVAGLAARLPRLLGDRSTAADAGPVEVEPDRFDLAVVGLLTALAHAYGGLLLVVDDAQWLDPVTGRVLARLAAELDGVPLLALLLARADPGPAGSGPAVPLLARPDLVLDPLPDATVAELLRAALPGADAGPRLTELIVARSSGNPLVAHVYLQAVIDAGLLRPHWGTWTLDEEGLRALDLPEDAAGLVLARLRRLPTRTTDLLATAAVVGLRFCSGTVAAVHGCDELEVATALGRAVEHGLLEAQGEQVFTFVHEALRQALLDDLDSGEAVRRHLTVATVYEAEAEPPDGWPDDRVFAVAHHYLAAGAGDPARPAPGDLRRRAFEALRRAGVLALHTHAPAQAVEFLRGARALEPVAAAAGDARAGSRLAFQLGVALHRAAAFEEAVAVLAEALKDAHEPLLRAEIIVEISVVERAMWKPERALSTARQGLAELGAPLPRSGAGLALSVGWTLVKGSFVRRTGWGFGTARGTELERCRAIRRLHVNAAFAGLLNGAIGSAVLFQMRATSWAYRIGSGADYVAARMNVALFALAAGRVAAAKRVYAELSADPGWADPMLRAALLDGWGGCHYFFGTDDGELFAEALLSEGRWVETPLFRDGVDALALHEANAGRTRRAVEWSERGRLRLEAAGEASRTPVHRLTTAMLDAVCGRPGQASALLRDVEAGLPVPCPVGIAVVHRLAGIVVLREQDETGEPFDQAVRAFEELGLAPRALLRMHRIVYFHVALGRLAQARRASADERAARLVQARASLGQLRRFRSDADLRALERVGRADLLLLAGDPRAALRALAETDDADRYDVPLAAYEGARVRARVFAALGTPEEGDRWARFALAVAEDEGWSHRAAWVVNEFGVSAVRRARLTAYGLTPPTTVGGGIGGSALSNQARVPLQQERLAALQHVGLAASREVDPAALARISLDLAIRILGAERAFLFLTDDTEHLVPFLGRSAAGDDVAEPTGYTASLVERVHADGQPLVVTGTDEGAALGAQSVVLHGLRSIVIAPLRLEQRRLGVIYLDSQVAKGIFTPDDVDFLTALTTQIAISLETARAARLAISVQIARRERDLAERLRETSEALAGATSPEQVLAGLVDRAAGLTRSDAAWVIARGRDGDRLFGESGPPAGEPVVADAALDALLAAWQPVTGPPNAVPAVLQERVGDASWLALPLRSVELHAGVLILREAPAAGAGDPPTPSPADDRDLASALVAQAAIAYDRATLFARVQALAVADELTGVANRWHFFEVARRDVETCRRTGRPLAAVMVDIDHFKAVNDTYGHPTGDDVIRSVAARLAAELRSTDLLGRYGGEEFAIVMVDALAPEEPAERLRAAIAGSPIATRSGPLDMTVSVGVAGLDAGDDLESLLARADRALYRAKQDGRNRVCGDRSDEPVVPAQRNLTV
jgi:diguanylate cyclase (GGDEF)-like protein